jgi:hypothetical protein
MESRKAKQVLSEGWYWWEVLEGECAGNITYFCVKMEK